MDHGISVVEPGVLEKGEVCPTLPYKSMCFLPDAAPQIIAIIPGLTRMHTQVRIGICFARK